MQWCALFCDTLYWFSKRCGQVAKFGLPGLMWDVPGANVEEGSVTYVRK